MIGSSLWWIDWGRDRGPMWWETALRFLLCFLAAVYLLGMLLSGGVDRFLSEQFTVTAILRSGVSDEEGQGIAGKVAALPAVRDARYRSPEEAWKEFLASYPGLESLRGGGKSPLPGYVEVHLRRGGMSRLGIARTRSALEPLPQVEKVLAGGSLMPHVLRLKRWADAVLWAGFALVCAVFLVVVAIQERARATRLLPEVRFLSDRGIPGRNIASRRAAGTFLTGVFLALLALAASGAIVHFATVRFPFLRDAVGPAPELLRVPAVLCAGLFVLSAAAVQGLSSLAAWSAASRKGR